MRGVRYIKLDRGVQCLGFKVSRIRVQALLWLSSP